VSRIVEDWRFRGDRGCRWCACGPGLLAIMLMRGRRRCCPKGPLLCLAVLLGSLGLAWLLWVLRRYRAHEKNRSDYPGQPDPGKRPEPSVQRVPPEIYRRPDPMIYSQEWLKSQSVAVTWDNPDVHIERDGKPVSSHDLEPATKYEIVARVWNGSEHAPAVGLPVRFKYAGFGIGIAGDTIGEQPVDLAVKGAPGCPAFARQPWTTPPDPGHYCLQVQLIWPDDANPANNVGQENTDVKPLNSPRASFVVPVRNDGPDRQPIRLQVDSYRLGAPAPCPSDRARDEREREARRRRARARHTDGAHPVPDGWTVSLQPVELTLSPGEQADVKVVANAPEGFDGRQAFNVNALAGERLIGGVTLIADGKV
jgi:hypothetical protein